MRKNLQSNDLLMKIISVYWSREWKKNLENKLTYSKALTGIIMTFWSIYMGSLKKNNILFNTLSKRNNNSLKIQIIFLVQISLEKLKRLQKSQTAKTIEMTRKTKYVKYVTMETIRMITILCFARNAI